MICINEGVHFYATILCDFMVTVHLIVYGTVDGTGLF